MPKSLAIAGIECEKVSFGIPGEGQSGIRGQHSGAGTSRAKFMGPADLAGLVVDRLQHALAPQPIIRTSPTVGTIRRLIEVEAEGGVSIDNKQTSLRVEARRTVVGESTLIRCNQAPVGRRILRRIWNGTALLVDARSPVHGAERNREQALAVGPIQNEEISIAGGLHQHLAGLTMEGSVYQHWYFNRVPVMSVMRRRLKRPH